MARSHHRKKHKSHVKQFRQAHDSTAGTRTRKGKVTPAFTIIGGIVGAAVGFFAAGGDLILIVLGFLAGAIGGYFVGRHLDRDKD